MTPKKVIKHNIRIMSEFADKGEWDKVETMVELLCLQVKILLDHEVICTVNKDSLKRMRDLETINGIDR